MKSNCVVTLKQDREKPVVAGHPWIFSGAVGSIDGYTRPGQLCTVIDSRRRFLAYGYVNTSSQITVRLLAGGAGAEDLVIDADFITRRLEQALDLRESLFGIPFVRAEKSAYRLVNGEGDFLPGLIVDRYGSGLVLQALTAGMQQLKGLLVDSLRGLLNPAFIYEKIDLHMAAAEGLNPASAGLTDTCLHGSLTLPIEIAEQGARFHVDVEGGQKTGFYLDQRRNRGILRDISAGLKVLNGFSYTGAFAIQALLGGAVHAQNVDLSEEALRTSISNAALNDIGPDRFATARADVFQFLRQAETVYDIIVLDPPKFAAAKGALPGALRGYKDINLCALKRVRPGGFLMSFSCSGLVPEELFQKVVFGAATDAGRSVQILRRLHADADHPVNLAHREGHYLKGLLLRVR